MISTYDLARYCLRSDLMSVQRERIALGSIPVAMIELDLWISLD